MTTRIPTVVLPSAGAEMLMTFAALNEMERGGGLEVGDAFVKHLRQSAGDALTRRAREFAGAESYVWINLLPVAVADRDATSVGSLINRLQDMPPEDVLRHACGVLDPGNQSQVPPDVIEAALAGWTWARARIRNAQGLLFPPRLVSGQPEEHVGDLIDLLRDWDRKVWSSSEHLMMPAITRDSEYKKRRQVTMEAEAFLIATTGGVTWSRLPDVGEVVLTPSYVLRPWMAHTETPARLVIAYPVEDENLGSQNDAAVRRLGRVLRARTARYRRGLVRELGASERTVAELSARLDVEPSALLGDLVSLRAVGMVVVDVVTHRYRLRRGDLDGFGQLVSAASAIATTTVRRVVESA